jgi:hypothetical protein
MVASPERGNTVIGQGVEWSSVPRWLAAARPCAAQAVSMKVPVRPAHVVRFPSELCRSRLRLRTSSTNLD